MKSTQRLAVLGGALAASAVVIGTAVAAPSTSAPPPPAVSAAQAQSNAAAAASDLVAHQPGLVHAGPRDRLVQRVIRSTGGLQYVVYDRTYDGLRVVGGDLVIATDERGTVKATSVAQDQALGQIDTGGARLTRPRAEEISRAEVAKVTATRPGDLVVVAEGAGRLAYETVVDGTDDHNHPSSTSVYVDATDGRVLRKVEHIAAGTGTGNWNGPNLPLNTTQSGGSYSLRDPNIANLTCRDYANDTVFSGSDDSWGNGSGSNKETGCADSLYTAQTENKMLSQWLGRNSFDGQGGAWKINVGLNDQNAYYYNSRPAYVYIGRNPSGNWVGSLDIVGHEMGHGIDDYSGTGGLSGGGTQEFVADTFGAATEWFAGNSQYDPPDYEIGEEVNLVGSGPLRYMYQPSKHGGDPNCYSSSIPNAEVHAAAGPGDHWFYLLAEGSNPTNGQPASSTCNSSSVTGIGIQKAIKIMHGAVQLKTSNSNYPRYRTWTLQAAKDLYPNSCSEFAVVKAAWDAVSVPAQSADPTCTGGPTSTTPTTTTTRPTTTTQPTTTTTTPPGGCSGQKLTNPGFESGRTTWTGDTAAIGQWGGQGKPARTGTWDVWLNGYGRSTSESLSQQVVIPSGCRATLGFWLHVDSAETENVVYDKLSVSVGSTVVATYSNLDKANGYTQKTVDVSAYAGQTVTLKFNGVEDASQQTSFVIDDTTLTLN